MECTYVKENLLETRNNLLYPELAKLFKQLLSVKDNFSSSIAGVAE